MTTTLPSPSLRLVPAFVVIPRVVLVVGPWMVLVLELNLHGLRALSDEVPMLSASVAHARAPPNIILVHLHALESPAQQCEVLLA
jgi:hypothetical protein